PRRPPQHEQPDQRDSDGDRNRCPPPSPRRRHRQARVPRTRVSIRSTWASGGCGKMPWPRLKMNGPSENTSRMRSIERSSATPPRPETSLHRHAPLDLIAREHEVDGPIKPYGIDRDVLDIAQKRSADPAGEPNHSRPRHVPTHLGDDSLRGLDAPAGEFLG